MLKLKHLSTIEYEFGEIQIFYVVTKELFSLVSKYDQKEDGYYILNFNFGTHTIQEDVIIYGRIVSMGRQLANVIYISTLRQT